MRRLPLLARVAAVGLGLAATALPAGGQTRAYPAISARQFVSGSAKVSVKGSVQIDQDVPINTKASIGDGETTWLQFGVSGAETPNALITYGETGEIGVGVGKGKFVVTAMITPGEAPQCSGKAEVTGTSITGHYSCAGITSYDAATGKMGKVDIEVSFTAKS